MTTDRRDLPILMAEEFRPGTFDGAAVWATLTPEQQAEIGSRALEYVAACEAMSYGGYSDVGMPWSRAGEASIDAAQSELENCVDSILGTESFYGPDEHPLLPSCVGMFCRVCGCSHEDACITDGEACSWADDYLCSACAEVDA